jgi:hypothetical protein
MHVSFSTFTTAPSLRPSRPKRFPYNVPLSPGSHHHPKVFLVFLFPTVGPNSWRGRCPTYPVLRLTLLVGFFYHFGGDRPLHKAQLLIFSNPLDIPVARFTNSSPKAFLSNCSDVLSMLRRSCRLVPGFFIHCCLVAAVLGLGPSCHCCIPDPSNVSSRTSVLTGILVRHLLCFVPYACVPNAVPLLYCRSSSYRLRPILSAVHDFPGSEFS